MKNITPSNMENSMGAAGDYFDVVIVGCGPGGLASAEILANSDLRVLLLEKNPQIGPKICAGGLTKKCMSLLNLPESFPGKKYQKINYETMYNNSLIDYGENYIQIIDRKELGQWQLAKISDSKIDICTNAQVTKVEKDFIISSFCGLSPVVPTRRPMFFFAQTSAIATVDSGDEKSIIQTGDSEAANRKNYPRVLFR